MGRPIYFAPPPVDALDGYLRANGRGVPPPKKKRTSLSGISDRDMATASEQAAKMRESEDWTGARGLHFVALHDELHTAIYGVGAPDLDDGRKRRLATIAADRLIRDTFKGDAYSFSVYFVWAWARAERREVFCRAQKKTSSALTWRRVFTATHDFGDWRMDAYRTRTKLPPAFQDESRED